MNMKKLMSVAVLAALAAGGAMTGANADDKTDAAKTAAIKAACEKSDKTVWVDQTKVCVPVNPCTDTSGKYEAYCIREFENAAPSGSLETLSWVQEQFIRLYVDNVFGWRVPGTIKFIGAEIGILTGDGNYQPGHVYVSWTGIKTYRVFDFGGSFSRSKAIDSICQIWGGESGSELDVPGGEHILCNKMTEYECKRRMSGHEWLPETQQCDIGYYRLSDEDGGGYPWRFGPYSR
ncbi:hypothetical protein FACS189421_11900 [Bacteroidia bacterium]|nr:hypothetical protein FACS189421_11900 [Bacteroidia bacterium]